MDMYKENHARFVILFLLVLYIIKNISSKDPFNKIHIGSGLNGR